VDRLSHRPFGGREGLCLNKTGVCAFLILAFRPKNTQQAVGNARCLLCESVVSGAAIERMLAAADFLEGGVPGR
jgi:hypothetical protein